MEIAKITNENTTIQQNLTLILHTIQEFTQRTNRTTNDFIADFKILETVSSLLPSNPEIGISYEYLETSQNLKTCGNGVVIHVYYNIGLRKCIFVLDSPSKIQQTIGSILTFLVNYQSPEDIIKEDIQLDIIPSIKEIGGRFPTNVINEIKRICIKLDYEPIKSNIGRTGIYRRT